MIKIIVDSTCDMPENIYSDNEIKMVPLVIGFNGKDYLDKVTIGIDEVYAAMKKDILPKTSQPRPVDFYRIFEEYASKGVDFLFLSFSSRLSGTYQLAYSIIQEMKSQYPNVNMEAIDTKSGSSAIGLIVIQAVKLIEADYSFLKVTEILKELIQYVEHIFTITDLNWLIKGGRIGRGQGVIGNILDIKPILEVKDGFMEVIAKVRGSKRALNNVVELVASRIAEFPDQVIGISHADDLESALLLKKMIIDKIGDKKIMIDKIGSVLGTHLGIGGVGVFFFNKRPEVYID